VLLSFIISEFKFLPDSGYIPAYPSISPPMENLISFLVISESFSVLETPFVMSSEQQLMIGGGFIIEEETSPYSEVFLSSEWYPWISYSFTSTIPTFWLFASLSETFRGLF
jgi:hypothetical protein